MLKQTSMSVCAGAIAALLAFGACSREDNSAGRVSAQQAAVAPASNGLDGTGVLRPAQVFALRVKPGERVDRIEVKAGDPVQAGDTLATLSCPSLQTEWLATHAQILELRRDAAQIDALRWKKEVAESRLAGVVKQITVAESLRGQVAGYDPQVHARDLLEDRTRIEKEIEGLAREISAGVQLQQAAGPLLRTAEQRVLQLEAQISNLVVRAPWAGVVVRVESAPAAADGVLLEIHDRSRFRVQGMLWQNQLATVKTGDLVTVIPDFIPGCSWTGTVTAIGLAAVIDATQSFPRFPLTITLSDVPETELLRDGMTVFVQIHRSGVRRN